MFSVDRGCAASTDCPAEASGTEPTYDKGVLSRKCCTTDLCNTWGDTHSEGYRRSREYFRDLMEGTPRNAKERKVAWSKDVGNDEGVLSRDDNSASSARGSRGSLLATVLVIVGTFAQALWLAGSLMQ